MEQFKSLFNNGALFEQFEVRRWLERRNQGTKETYISALKTFTEFTKLTPKQLIDMAEGDRKKSIREQGEPELKVKSFYEYFHRLPVEWERAEQEEEDPEERRIKEHGFSLRQRSERILQCKRV